MPSCVFFPLAWAFLWGLAALTVFADNAQCLCRSPVLVNVASSPEDPPWALTVVQPQSYPQRIPIEGNRTVDHRNHRLDHAASASQSKPTALPTPFRCPRPCKVPNPGPALCAALARPCCLDAPQTPHPDLGSCTDPSFARARTAGTPNPGRDPRAVRALPSSRFVGHHLEAWTAAPRPHDLRIPHPGKPAPRTPARPRLHSWPDDVDIAFPVLSGTKPGTVYSPLSFRSCRP